MAVSRVWLKELWYIHTMENHEALKKNKNIFMPQFRKMFIEIMLIEKNKIEKYHQEQSICICLSSFLDGSGLKITSFTSGMD